MLAVRVRFPLRVQIQSEKQSESGVSSSEFHSFSHSNSLGMFDFQKLEVYKKAKVFHTDLKSLIESQALSYTEKDQLYRASFSIALNIAEGSGRFSERDRRNFFVIARSSVFECVAILDILKDGSIITERTYSDFEAKADELSRMLFGLIRKLG